MERASAMAGAMPTCVLPVRQDAYDHGGSFYAPNAIATIVKDAYTPTKTGIKN